ncbi:cadherin-like domain-containing protein [Phormidium tenue FACHB-886]|nr:cadherin-like domain-containing protein [Phormidium tenue FACHB-886]
MPKFIINEFYRGSNLTAGDEFIELLLLEDSTAAQLNSFFVGDSTGSKASKFSAYDFTSTESIAPVFKAGTIIAIGGATAFTQDTSYNPTGGDWNIFLNAGGSFLPNANSGNNGDIAGDDVVWVDAANTGSTISSDGFAVDIGTATGAFTSAANVNFGTSTNNTGYALNSDLAGASNTANWTTGRAFGATTPGQGNGVANTTYINSLRGSTPPPTTTVSIQATDATAAEAGSDSGIFRIARTGDTTADLPVNYTAATGADQTTNGTDYTPNLTGTATIAAGQSFVDITITPVDDTEVEGNETVILTLVDAAEYDLETASTATVTIADNDIGPGAIRIHDIQGAAHRSPWVGQTVSNVPGIVTALATNGFYLQDPNPDNDDSTSEGIFVFTSSAPTVAVGDSVLVSGAVSEFRPGNNANNLTITQIASPTITTVSSGNALPTATILGNGGRAIPTEIITNDAAGGSVENAATPFDPAEDGIDFYESLEGMQVQINNPVTTSPTANFGSSEEIWVLADNGANATSRTARGGSLITATDFNPERIQLDDLVNSALTLPTADVGAQLSTITGVVSYDFNNYEVLASTAPTVVQPSTLQKEVTNLTGNAEQLTVATFNVENLDPGDGAAKFGALANAIVNNLKSPDIISLEEIQDNNGPTNDSVVDASVTFQALIDAIATAGGPTYEYRQISPVDDTNGGEPGGNIRVGFLYNPGRVDFVDRSGSTSTSSTTVTDASNDGTPDLSASPGLIDPTNPAFNASRKPLVGEFVFNGQTVYVIGNHFNSKGGDDPLFGPNQPPSLSSEAQRNQQATIVRDFVQNILSINPNANVVVAGDLNDFEFSNPLSILESGGLNTLIETLPANERYTYNFQGNAQTLDHILVSNNLLTNLNGYDVVHINSEFTDQISDHDPVLARFNLATPNTAPIANPDSASTAQNQPVTVDVLANDTDAEQDALNVTGSTTPSNGILTNNNGSFIYTPNSGFSGTDSFTYTISDGKGGSATATVSIAVGTRQLGGNGTDNLSGNDGADYLEGGNGVDTLDGGAGNDTLIGGNGEDILIGGAGADQLTGNNGADTFRYASLTDSLLGAFDQITDLKIGTDIIDAPNVVSAANVAKLGEVSNLTEAGVAAVLTNSSFSANGAATFTAGSRTFLALNDSTAGFSTTADAVVEITGYSGNLNSLAIA